MYILHVSERAQSINPVQKQLRYHGNRGFLLKYKLICY